MLSEYLACHQPRRGFHPAEGGEAAETAGVGERDDAREDRQ